MRLNHLSLEVRPVVKVGPVRAHPKARAPATSVWYSKTARVYLSVPAGTDVATLTTGQLASGLGLTGSESNLTRVTGLKAWNMTQPGGSSQFLRIADYQALVDPSVSTVSVEDVGTATSLPGVYVNVPDSHTVSVTTTVGGTTGLVDLAVTNTGLGPTTAVQKVCLDLYCLVKQ